MSSNWKLPNKGSLRFIQIQPAPSLSTSSHGEYINAEGLKIGGSLKLIEQNTTEKEDSLVANKTTTYWFSMTTSYNEVKAINKSVLTMLSDKHSYTNPIHVKTICQ